MAITVRKRRKQGLAEMQAGLNKEIERSRAEEKRLKTAERGLMKYWLAKDIAAQKWKKRHSKNKLKQMSKYGRAPAKRPPTAYEESEAMRTQAKMRKEFADYLKKKGLTLEEFNRQQLEKQRKQK